MVFLKKQLLALLARPVLLPIAVGSFGLWYGTYDLSRMFSGFVLPARINQDSKSYTRNLSIAGLGYGLIYVRSRVAPESGFSMPTNLNTQSVVESARSVKGLPIRYHFASVFFSGLVCGVYSSLYDCIVE